jgi:hypothetical protein
MKRWKLFAALVALLCLGVVVMAFITMAGQEFTGLITGIVIDAGGKPVAGAWVMVSCGDRPLAGRIPGALSDDHGHFAVGSLELARCSVVACKEEDDIPCPPFSYVTHGIQVTLTAKAPLLTVKVRLGEKAPVITGTVRDATSGKPLAANFTVRSLKFPDRGMSMSMSSPPAFRIFITPSTNYSFEVSAPGYRDWSYADQQNSSRPLRLAPRAHLRLDVQLEPLN